MSVILLLLITAGAVNRLGIVGAMDVELDLLKENMLVERVDSIAQRVFYSGKLDGMECICVKAGIGKVNAALTAEILIMKYDVDAVVFTGVAGGINPQLDIGDIVISKRVIHHDYGQVVPDAFVPWDTVGYSADSLLVDIAERAARSVKFEPLPKKLCKETGRLPRIVTGRVVTGDQFIASEQKRKWIEETFHGDCVEMEGAAVAQVCTINDIPFVIIRCLSDLANEKADVEFETFVLYAAKNSNLIVKEILNLLRK